MTRRKKSAKCPSRGLFNPWAFGLLGKTGVWAEFKTRSSQWTYNHSSTLIHTYRVGLQRSNITPREQGATPDRAESREKNRLRETDSERESEEQRRVETLSHLPALCAPEKRPFNTHYTRATGSCSWERLCVFVW